MSIPAPSRRPPWIGFIVGLLVVVLPLAAIVVLRSARRHPEETAAAPPATRAAPRVDYDAMKLRPSGESLPDPEPPPDAETIRRALSQAEGWLAGLHTDPFGGAGIDSIGPFTLETECWHRLAVAEDDPARRARLEASLRERLRRVLDPGRLAERLRGQRTTEGLLEILILASMGRAHGVDVAPMEPLLRSIGRAVDPELPRLPPSTAALFAGYLGDLGVPVSQPLDHWLAAGVIASRPREVDLDLAHVYGLTQEIYARTGGAERPLPAAAPAEMSYLKRTLPFLAMTYTLLRQPEMTGMLLSCLNVAGMTGTYGYREPLRAMILRQNPDGSFGDAGAIAGAVAGGGRAALLSPTASCVTALSLERVRSRSRASAGGE